MSRGALPEGQVMLSRQIATRYQIASLSDLRLAKHKFVDVVRCLSSQPNIEQ